MQDVNRVRGWLSHLWVQWGRSGVGGRGGSGEEKGTDLSIRLLSFDGQGLCFWVALCKHSGQLLGSLGSMDSAKSYMAARTSMVLRNRKSNGGCAWKAGGAGLLDSSSGGRGASQINKKWSQNPISPSVFRIPLTLCLRKLKSPLFTLLSLTFLSQINPISLVVIHSPSTITYTLQLLNATSRWAKLEDLDFWCLQDMHKQREQSAY